MQVCLKHYDYNAEAVINAVLEDNLPPHLNQRHVPDVQPIVETNFPFQDPADISKKTRTKYVTIFIKNSNIPKNYEWKPVFIIRTVHFDEMREILNDKQDMKNVILERVNEQIAAEVIILIFLIVSLIHYYF